MWLMPFTEKLVLATKTTARKELILLHDERAVAPGSTRPWLRVSRVSRIPAKVLRIALGYMPITTSNYPV